MTDHKMGDLVSALRGGAVLAPMSGVTDLPFRRVVAGFGASMVVSEMVASDHYVRGAEEARLRAEGQGVRPHVVQLAGCDPSWMAEAARLAEASGADVVDINMGCPAKKVTGGYAGSALMRDLDHAERLIAAVTRAVCVPVTVKMRLGWDHDSLNAPELARRAEAHGVAALAVHGRTRQQFYKSQADWGAIAAVTKAVDLPVVANGDIRGIADARRALALSGASAVMIGREAIGRPWLVGQVAAGLTGRPVHEPSAMEREAAAIEQYEGMLAHYGSRMAVRHARKHLAAYAEAAGLDGFLVPTEDRRRLLTSDEPQEVTAVLRSLFRRPVREAA